MIKSEHRPVTDLNNLQSVPAESDKPDNVQQPESQVKTYLDADNANSTSDVTWMTDTSSIFRNPSSLAGVSSSKLEIQLNFLARELELERQRREKLQRQVEEMQENLTKQNIESEREVSRFKQEKEQRELNIKKPNMDLTNLKVLEKGFVSP